MLHPKPFCKRGKSGPGKSAPDCIKNLDNFSILTAVFAQIWQFLAAVGVIPVSFLVDLNPVLILLVLFRSRKWEVLG